MFKTSPVHARYGVRIHDVQLNDIWTDSGFAELRDAFETYSFLYFADQQLDDSDHLRLSALFGHREGRSIHANKPNPEVSMVSNVKAGDELFEPGERDLLQLQANPGESHCQQRRIQRCATLLPILVTDCQHVEGPPPTRPAYDRDCFG
jgi:hypothetical protein